jgi:hypothetical protein
VFRTHLEENEKDRDQEPSHRSKKAESSLQILYTIIMTDSKEFLQKEKSHKNIQDHHCP